MPTQRPHGRTSSLVVVRQCDPDIASVSKTTSRLLDRSAPERCEAISDPGHPISKKLVLRKSARCRASRGRAGGNFRAPAGLNFGASLRSFSRRKTMPNVYVEARPKGRQEGTPIDDYVVEDHADHVLGTFKTQGEAIKWAEGQGHSPLVARVRHLNDKKKPDHWRGA
jgi:hypothetical protein